MKGYDFARRASLKSDYPRCHTGAAAFYHGKLLALGWNGEKTCPLQAKYNHHRGFDSYKYPARIHAEMMIVNKIKNLDIDFSKVEVYVWRGTRHPMISRPCPACETAMRDLGIRKVHYTGNNSYIDEEYI